MKNNISIFNGMLYVAAFSPFFLEVLGLKESFFSYVSLGLDLGILYLGIPVLNKSRQNFVVFISIILISFFTYYLHTYSLVSHVNGLREVIDIVLFFSFYENIARQKYKYILDEKIMTFIKVFLVLQIPITSYQFLVHGAGDFVGGSLGKGNSGILTLVILLMVYFLIKKKYKEYGYKAYISAIFLFPLFINETKISFVLIPIMFLFLSNIKKFSTVMVGMLGAGLFFLLLSNLYTDRGQKFKNPFEQIFNESYLDNYLLGPDAASKKNETIDVPRFTKIILAVRLIDKDVSESLFGIQYGAFKGGKVLDVSNFSRTYDWLLLGSRPYVFYLLITGGWLLLIVVFFYLTMKIFMGFKKYAPDRRFSMLCGIIIIVILFYNDSIRDQFFIMMLAYFVVYSKGHNKYILWQKSKNYRMKKLLKIIKPEEQINYD